MKKPQQKLKILYVLQYLYQYSDEEHPVSTKDIIAYLDDEGISAERKSVYKDLDALVDFGFDIIKNGGQNASYYLASRTFELVEIKILLDAVCTSKFLTPKKTQEIITKLQNFTSKHQAAQLQRNVHVMSKMNVKSENEQIYYNIDKIHRAIQGKLLIHFYYTKWELKSTSNKVQYDEVRRNDGQKVKAFPIALLWDDEHYYLLAEDLKSGIQKHYRLDRMQSIDIAELASEASRRKALLFEPDKYSRRIFDMYHGEDYILTLSFEESIVSSILDRFGQDIIIEKDKEKENWFKTKQVIKVSDRFYAWVAAFGGKVKISEPAALIEEYKNFLKRSLALYDEE